MKGSRHCQYCVIGLPSRCGRCLSCVRLSFFDCPEVLSHSPLKALLSSRSQVTVPCHDKVGSVANTWLLVYKSSRKQRNSEGCLSFFFPITKNR